MVQLKSLKRFLMMVLKKLLIDDDTKKVSKKFQNNGINTVSKGSTVMILKKFFNDGTKKVP